MRIKIMYSRKFDFVDYDKVQMLEDKGDSIVLHFRGVDKPLEIKKSNIDIANLRLMEAENE